VVNALRDSTNQERRLMGNNAKRKTTMAKLNRERRLRERRLEKQARKDARKRASTDDAAGPGDTLSSDDR
jgi:hypothetical protein